MSRPASQFAAVTIAIALLTLLVVTDDHSYGMDQSQGMKQGMMQLMEKDPQLMDEIMGDPHHELAMAYRKSLVSYARALRDIAQQEETIPSDAARTAIEEMKRSVDLLDREHSRVVSDLDQEKRARLGNLPDMMKQHVEGLKLHVSNLERLLKGEQVQSSAVLKEVQALLASCRNGMQGGQMKAGEGMRMHHARMENEMGDTELMDLSNRMNRASGDEKTAIMAEILTRLVNRGVDREGAGAAMPPHYSHHSPAFSHDCSCFCNRGAEPSDETGEDEDEM